jgi:hypothetical protein
MIGDLRVHCAAEMFRMMNETERASLIASIERDGFHADEPVLLTPDGEIIDGRNRTDVCLALGIKPVFRTLTIKEIGSPTDFVKNRNARRHHTREELAAAAVEIESGYAREAKERQSAALKQNRKTVTDEPSVTDRHANESATRAAKSIGAGIKSTETLKAVKKTAPEVFDAVRDGKLNVSQAKALAKAPELERARAMKRIASGERPGSVVRDLPSATPRPRDRDWDHDGELIELNRLMNRIRIECPPERRGSLAAFFASWSRRLEEMNDVRETG